MILELIKLAGKMELSLKFNYQDDKLSCEVVDDHNISWYSYQALDSIDVMTTIHTFLADPHSFLKSFIEATADLPMIEPIDTIEQALEV